MLKLAAVFGDSMVLCRGKVICIFGEAQDGAAVSAKLCGAGGTELASGASIAAGGRFLIKLPPQEAAADCTLTVTAGQETVTARDVAIGEVYLAGGQSNMEMALKDALGGEELIASHNDPMLRYYNVPKVAVTTEETLKAEAETRWTKLVPGAGNDVSAVAYFFAVRLRKLLNVPVGIVGCNWGGTSISCWMSREALMDSAEGARYWNEYFTPLGDQTLEQFNALNAEYNARVDAWRERENDLFLQTGHRTLGSELEKKIGPFPWPPPNGVGSFMRPAGLYETMVSRIASLTLTGVLFYQGEQDCGVTRLYDVLMTGLVRCWRDTFLDEELPFLFTQLPMWLGDGPEDGNWPAMRRMQARGARLLQNVELAIQIDQGEKTNIHPVNKEPVGERLYQLARELIYGLEGERSPEALYALPCGGSIRITLSAPVHGEPSLFEVAGADGVYYPAEAQLEGSSIVLRSAQVERPESARYAWVNWGETALAGENGLPLAPFVL